MSSIPDDLYLEILIRLPVKSIFRCKCVSKSWFSLISNPDFVKKHLDCTVENKSRCRNFLFAGRDAIYSLGYDSFQSSLLSGIKVNDDDDDFEIVDNPFKYVGLSIGLVGSSCNGLVCLKFYEYYESDVRFYGIWNPATREFKKIPIPPEGNGSIWIYAFGYDFQNDDYKLLTLSATHSSVFTLGLNRWESNPVTRYDWWTECNWNGVLVNRKLHWLTVSDGSRNIVSLDLSNERFELMQQPIRRTNYNWCQNMLPGVLDGCLCLVVEVSENRVFDLWVMQDYGVPESWTKRHRITNDRTKGIPAVNIIITGNFKNGQILFMGPGKLMLYDLNHGGGFRRNIRSADITSVDTYVESLISLKSGTYMERGQIEKNQLKRAYKGVSLVLFNFNFLEIFVKKITGLASCFSSCFRTYN